MRPSPHSTFPHYSISKMASASQENINLQVAQGRQQENSDNNSAYRPPPAPSSAAAERALSILNASFNDQQHHALSDYLQASVMLQYNKR